MAPRLIPTIAPFERPGAREGKVELVEVFAAVREIEVLTDVMVVVTVAIEVWRSTCADWVDEAARFPLTNTTKTAA